MLLAGLDFKNFFNTFWSNSTDGLALGAVYALVALGYTLVYGVLRLINFANSEVFMVGTFGSVIALNIMGIGVNTTPSNGGKAIVTMLLMLLISVVFSTVTAILLERFAYRPLRKRNAPRLVFLISAIGASLALAAGVERFGPRKSEDYGTGQPFAFAKQGLFGTGFIKGRHILVIGGALAMMALLTALVSKTRLGRGMRAVAQDSESARILGVNTEQIILVTFALGGLMAGAAAFLYMIAYTSTSATVGFILGVKSFTAAVLGGIGNIKGALLGGLLLGLLESWGAGLFGGQWKDVVAFVILVVVLMFRPTGLLGESLGRARA
jgi:branched-chain amino acid transport system permease protein